MSILALNSTMNEFMEKVRREHPNSGFELVGHLVDEVKKPSNESLVEACVRFACLDAVKDYHRQQDEAPGKPRLFPCNRYIVSTLVADNHLPELIEAALDAGGTITKIEKFA